MKWKIVHTFDIENLIGDKEKYHLYLDEDSLGYKIQNEFGNIKIEFNQNSGFDFAENLLKIIRFDIHKMINNFLNK